MAIQNNPLTKHGIILSNEIRDALKESVRSHIKTTLKTAFDKAPLSERLKLLNSLEAQLEPKIPIGLDPIEEEPRNMLASSFHSLKEKIMSKFKK